MSSHSSFAIIISPFENRMLFPIVEKAIPLSVKNFPHNSKTTFEMRENMFEII